ncbi:ComF family protein [Rothia nasimurium]|uniref:ComF family protein n=1 Tax=Rothia nasimurium TaxID=85336 RepID=UPI00117BBFF2|nr:hypothetical protein [Rothia nasimurium]
MNVHVSQLLYRSWCETVELFFPRACASCLAVGPVMVAGGLWGTGALCPLCDRLVRLATLQVELTELPATDLPVVTAGRYEYELARCLLAFKDAARTDLAPYLTSALVRALTALLDQPGLACPPGTLYLVPLPSSRASRRRRGYEPAPSLARSCLKALGPASGIKILPALMTRPRWEGAVRSLASGRGLGAGAAQKTLGFEQRLVAVQGRLALARAPLWFLGQWFDLTGVPCILVDDVATTGASMEAGRRLLVEAGAHVLGGIAVARVPRISANF